MTTNTFNTFELIDQVQSDIEEDFFQEMRIENDKLYRTGLSDYDNDRFNLREDYSWGF